MKIKYTAYTNCDQCGFEADYFTTILGSYGYFECPYCGWKKEVNRLSMPISLIKGIVVTSFFIFSLGCSRPISVDVGLNSGEIWDDKAAEACKELAIQTDKDSCWVVGIDSNFRAKCKCK